MTTRKFLGLDWQGWFVVVAVVAFEATVLWAVLGA